MFCKYCGTKLTEDSVFCHACGKSIKEQSAEQPAAQPAPTVSPVQSAYQPPVPPVPPVQSAYQRPVQPAPPAQPVYQQPAQPVYPQPAPQYHQAPPAWQPPARPVDPAQVAKLEKLAHVFGIVGLATSILGVPGIIFSSIAGNKANELQKLTGQLTGKARVGRNLAKAGKIVGIVATVFWVLLVSELMDSIANSEIPEVPEEPSNYYDF